MNTLLALLAAHLVADFPLQGESVAIQKNRHVQNALGRAVPWYYWMTAHAASHALAVFLATQSLGCALAELVCHWLIDAAKCEKWFSIHVDQALHVACKIVYVVFLFLVSCATEPLPPPYVSPNAASSTSCLTWACREEHSDCVLMTCERALPLMEHNICVMRGLCVEL